MRDLCYRQSKGKEILILVADSKPQTSVINYSNIQTEVVAKTSGILAAIDRCGCKHCLELLKSGSSNQPNPDDTATIPEPTGDGICLL